MSHISTYINQGQYNPINILFSIDVCKLFQWINW